MQLEIKHKSYIYPPYVYFLAIIYFIFIALTNFIVNHRFLFLYNLYIRNRTSFVQCGHTRAQFHRSVPVRGFFTGEEAARLKLGIN